jgi:hypothetical protein
MRLSKLNPRRRKTMPLAMITWINTEGHPEHPWVPPSTGGGVPPGYWGGVAPPLPTHPIAPGGPPPGYWGGVAPPLPTHPIAPGGPPLGIWGGGGVPMPTPPIYIPITPPPESGLSPEHPIYIPVYPDQGLPGPQPHPEHPIAMPHPKVELIKKIKAAVDFWTGNLPESPATKPEPVS